MRSRIYVCAVGSHSIGDGDDTIVDFAGVACVRPVQVEYVVLYMSLALDYPHQTHYRPSSSQIPVPLNRLQNQLALVKPATRLYSHL